MDDLRNRNSTRPETETSPPKGSFASSIFARLGQSLASHQITTILLCTVVICSLFFPALSLYFSPDGPASAVARRGRGFMVWELEGIQRQGMIWSEDQICWSKLASYTEKRRGKRTRIVRMEQVLISSSKSSFGGALDKQTLHQTLLVQDELSRRLLEGEIPGLTCVRTNAFPPACALSSPTNYWSSSSSLLADSDIHETLSLPSTADSSLPLTLTNTLVGVGRNRRGTVKGAHYMAITFYLEDLSKDLVLSGGGEDVEAVRDAAKLAWRRAVRDVIGGKGWESEREPIGKVGEGRGQGRRIVLKVSRTCSYTVVS